LNRALVRARRTRPGAAQDIAASLGFTALFIAVCLTFLAWIFRTGWRLKP
jgi:hypothetical protein